MSRKHTKALQRDQWIKAKHRYLYNDISYANLAKEMGIGRQGLMTGLRREFPKTDFKARKIEETKRREAKKVAKIKEKGEIKRLTDDLDLDATDDKDLEFINLLLDQAMVKCENGTLQVKNIKDIAGLINLRRTIQHKRTTNDRVITIQAEAPIDYKPLPEIIDGEFEVED